MSDNQQSGQTATTTTSTTEDASEYIYVSADHYKRKLQVENDSNSPMNLLTQPGPIGALMIYLFDTVIEFITRIVLYIFKFVGVGWDYVMAYTFGTFNGFLPNTNKNGIIVSYTFMRYILNIFLPPVGVYLSKGLYGWFNVIICFVLTYIHYILGIIYCFIITANNRYADLYEKTEINKIKAQNDLYKNPGKGDLVAFTSVIVIIGILLALVAAFIWFV